MSIEKIEKTFDKPINLVNLFSIVIIADCLDGVLYKENLLDLFTEKVLPIDRLFSIIYASLITCFIIKGILGACGKKIFLRFGNYFEYLLIVNALLVVITFLLCNMSKIFRLSASTCD